MFDEALVQVASGQLVRLPELSTRLAVGDKGDVSISQLCSIRPKRQYI
jgi:ubiquitin-conjugating enzyme E2 O